MPQGSVSWIVALGAVQAEDVRQFTHSTLASLAQRSSHAVEQQKGSC
jgi:hypothetical protein